MNQPSTAIALPSEKAGPLRVSQATAVEQARAIAEVQAAVVVAQQCPRDMARAEGEMRDACGRTALAARAFYRVPNRGSGPSVHLARELARIWGNVDYGVRELHRDDVAGESEILAYAWDVQTNTRSTRTFIVPHQRMKGGKRTDLTDLGDVYLNNQNIGARAVRECVFTVLPVWFVESAQELCNQTLTNGQGVPLPDRIEQMVTAFHAQFGVKAAQIEDRLQKKRGQWDAGDVAQMQITYGSLTRGEVTVEEEFPSARTTTDDVTGGAPAAEPAARRAPRKAKEDAPVAPEAPAQVPDATPPAPAAEQAPAAEPRRGVRPGGIDGSDRISARTSRHIFALCNDLGETDRQRRLAGYARVIGREVESTNDLTEDEGRAIVASLESWKSERATEEAGS